MNDKIDNDSIYYNVTNYLDVYDITINSIAINLNDYQVTNTTADKIHVEIDTTVKVKVTLLTDDEDSYYKDPDDKSIHYLETINLEVEEEFDVPVTASFTVISKEDYEPIVNIEKINEDKDLEFHRQQYDY